MGDGWWGKLIRFLSIIDKYIDELGNSNVQDSGAGRRYEPHDAGRVGKTSMTLKFTKNEFNEDQESSINACYLEKELKLINHDRKVKLAIWDTAGQEKYNAVAPVYYRDALGAIVVYEIVSTESFEKVKKWVNELREHANNKEIIIMIAGNKSDMENQRRVDPK